MNRQRLVLPVWRIASAGFVTLLLASCAMMTMSNQQVATAPPAPETVPQPAPPGSDAQQEIIVTAQRPGRGSGPDTPDPMTQESCATCASAATGAMMKSPGPFSAFASAIAGDDNALASVQPGEEVWVITKVAQSAARQSQADDNEPGSGAMVATFEGETDSAAGHQKQIPLPLRHTDVNAEINGYISSVGVTQSFENPFSEKIEAIYLFPLPEKAAVSEFVMIIGERRIRGILREKEQAREIYRQARAQGYQASLLVQHRPNVFEQKVANIEPGKTIDVEIQYFHTLAYEDGWYSFVFPTVVGPRYNPPGHTEGIGAVARDVIRPSGQAVSTRYLRPDERSAHDISINVELNAGVEIEELKSTHQIDAAKNSKDSVSVKLARIATIPNKDFILRFRVAGDTIKSGLLTWIDPATSQGYFTMMMYPPENVSSLQRAPMELVFVLDCSGSMNGIPLSQAKDAVLSALGQLTQDDTFQIIRFSDNASSFGVAPVPATPTNLRLARNYVKGLSGTGGTRMVEGVKAALEFPHDPARLRFVTFLTDGYIGNEKEIVAAVHGTIGASRVFSFGVGSSVNRFLLERMAAAGRGAVAYLGPNDSGSQVMSDFFTRISHPAMTDLEMSWGGMAVSDVYPARYPDLFVGRPLLVTGKFLGAANDIAVSGRLGNEQHRLSISKAAGADQSIARIWARLRIAELKNRQSRETDPYRELENAIRLTALEHQLMSDYTSFVAVDASDVTGGDHGTTVHQAVPVPQGVKYETTVNQD